MDGAGSKRNDRPFINGCEQNICYQGQYFNRETGLHFNTFRYFEPDIGRFTQSDPIGLRDGTNLYQYAPNPLTWSYPLGLAALGDYGQIRTIPGYLDTWIPGYLDTWIPGYLDTWIPGYQNHHNIIQSLVEYPAIIESKYDIHNSRNITILPSTKAAIAADPRRTIHQLDCAGGTRGSEGTLS
ncbi:RHS repeat-associated core domain-containing protein [Pseudomonas putida]